MAVAIRTGSIWPAIIYHFLWDDLLFLISSSARGANPDASDGDFAVMNMFAPMLLNLPNLIFALILLRNVVKECFGSQATLSGAGQIRNGK